MRARLCRHSLESASSQSEAVCDAHCVRSVHAAGRTPSYWPYDQVVTECWILRPRAMQVVNCAAGHGQQRRQAVARVIAWPQVTSRAADRLMADDRAAHASGALKNLKLGREAARDVASTAMCMYRPYMHPCVLPMHWQGQTSRECIVHSVSYAIRTMFSPLCLSKQRSAADVALAL